MATVFRLTGICDDDKGNDSSTNLTEGGEEMNRTVKLSKLAICLIVLVVFVSFPLSVYAKDKIVFGAARPLSGPLNFFEQLGFGPIYKMWVKEVNARGGIYVKEYGKRLPIEVITYDDKSDMGTMTRLLEKLMTKDKVDFVFSPCSTGFLYAATKIFNKHGYILMGAEGGGTTITPSLPTLPYVFMPLNYSDHYQVPVLADILQELGVKTAAIIFIADLHGIEYSGVAVPELAMHGVDIKMVKSVPPMTPDLSPLLKEAKAHDVDAFLSFTYPPETPTVTGQAIGLGINFDVFLLGPGGGYNFMIEAFGAEGMEGVMTWGAWNAKSSPAAAEFVKKYREHWGDLGIDWWGQLIFWGGLQFLEQAIVEAGTLDQKKIRDVMDKGKFDTALGPTWFEGGLLARECYAGQVGQWQSGVHEVIDPGKNRTAPPLYPKPPWPKPKPKK